MQAKQKTKGIIMKTKTIFNRSADNLITESPAPWLQDIMDDMADEQTGTTLHVLRDAIANNESLTGVGTVTEYLPNYAELTFTFNEGLTARIAGHGNGKFQMTLDSFYHIEPGTVDQVVSYLASI